MTINKIKKDVSKVATRTQLLTANIYLDLIINKKLDTVKTINELEIISKKLERIYSELKSLERENKSKQQSLLIEIGE